MRDEPEGEEENYGTPFQEKYSFEERKAKCEKFAEKYPDMVPVICTKKQRVYSAPKKTEEQTSAPPMPKKKSQYLVSYNIIISKL